MVFVHRRSFEPKALIELPGIVVDSMHEQYPAGDDFLGSEKTHERVLEECLAQPPSSLGPIYRVIICLWNRRYIRERVGKKPHEQEN